MKIAMIKTTYEIESEARMMACTLVRLGLVASVQLKNVESFYNWNNEFCNTKEIELTCYTSIKEAGIVKEIIKEQHLHQLPQIVAVEVEASDEFYQWVKDSVKPLENKGQKLKKLSSFDKTMYGLKNLEDKESKSVQRSGSLQDELNFKMEELDFFATAKHTDECPECGGNAYSKDGINFVCADCDNRYEKE